VSLEVDFAVLLNRFSNTIHLFLGVGLAKVHQVVHMLKRVVTEAAAGFIVRVHQETKAAHVCGLFNHRLIKLATEESLEETIRILAMRHLFEELALNFWSRVLRCHLVHQVEHLYIA